MRRALEGVLLWAPLTIKLGLCIAGLLCYSSIAMAGNSLSIRSANLSAYEDDFLLNADVEINFSTEMEKAIQKGFTFHFLIEFQLVSPQKYWFDDEIATATQQVALSYHALTRQYLVVRNDQQRVYASLDEAMEDLSIIQDVKVFEKSDVEKGEKYRAHLLMRLDHKKLPKALQMEGITSDDWQMVSPRFAWVPVLFK